MVLVLVDEVAVKVLVTVRVVVCEVVEVLVPVDVVRVRVPVEVVVVDVNVNVVDVEVVEVVVVVVVLDVGAGKKHGLGISAMISVSFKTRWYTRRVSMSPWKVGARMAEQALTPGKRRQGTRNRRARSMAEFSKGLEKPSTINLPDEEAWCHVTAMSWCLRLQKLCPKGSLNTPADS
mmetsp:Transcript_1816/g.5375  ORF Transcript_1816/g.5375 Transcript_1816/m.5375 type:complete len:177 (+) Transcript_1816:729-1259(+)